MPSSERMKREDAKKSPEWNRPWLWRPMALNRLQGHLWALQLAGAGGRTELFALGKPLGFLRNLPLVPPRTQKDVVGPGETPYAA